MSRLIGVSAEIPAELLGEFDRFMEELQAGRRPRMDVLTRDHSVIEQRSTTALVLLV